MYVDPFVLRLALLACAAVLAFAPAQAAVATASAVRHSQAQLQEMAKRALSPPIGRERIVDHRGLVIERITASSRDYNTGQYRVDSRLEGRFGGRSLDDLDISRLLFADAPQQASSYPMRTLHDVMALADGSALVIMGDTTRAGPRLIHLDVSPQSMLSARFVPLGGDSSPELRSKLELWWFLDGRVPGMTRVMAHRGRTVLVGLDKLDVYPLAAGSLLDVIDGVALMGHHNGAGRNAAVVAQRLVDGRELARLAIDYNCQRLPSFEFNHPRTPEYWGELGRPTTRDPFPGVGFHEAPDWWRRNFEWDAAKVVLRLRPDHALKPAPAQFIAVLDPDEGSEERQSRYGRWTVDADGRITGRPRDEASSPSSGLDYLDHVPLSAPDCGVANAAAAADDESKPAQETEIVAQVSATEFCLDPQRVDAKLHAPRCAAVQRRLLAGTTREGLSEVLVRYRPPVGPVREARAYELHIGGENTRHIAPGRQRDAGGEVREVLEIAPGRFALMVRGDGGPWQVWRWDLRGGLSYLGTAAFPAEPWQRTHAPAGGYLRSEGLFLPAASADVLEVGRFVLAQRGDGFIWAMGGSEGFSMGWSSAAGRPSNRPDRLQPRSQGPEWRVPGRCLKRADADKPIPPASGAVSLQDGGRWFDRNFRLEPAGGDAFAIRLRPDHDLPLRKLPGCSG